jgi:MSHA type pilus biogenesis protein MshL
MRKSILFLVFYFSITSAVLFAQDDIAEAPDQMQDLGTDQSSFQPESEPEPPSVAELESPAPQRAQEIQRPSAPVKSVSQISAPAAPAKKQISDKITLELKNMDVVEVIKLLSSKGGFDVVISQNVRGRITLFLNNVPIWDALQIVLRTTDLAYTKHGDIMRIVTEREYEQQYGKKFNDNREVRIIALKNTSVSDIGKEVKQLKSRIGNIIEDDRTNSLIVLDTPDSIKMIEDAVVKLDVVVETKIFELKYTAAKSLEEMLKKLISKKGILHVDDLTNKIIITDAPDVISQVTLVIKEYDREQYLETRIFTLSHAKFDKVEEKVKDMVTKDIGKIKSDERTNKVVVTDLPEKIREISKVIAAYDEKSRQVLIEAKIVQVALNDEFRMGINWQMILNKVLIEKWFHTDTIDMTLSSVFETLSEIGTSESSFDNDQRAAHPGGRTLISGTLANGNDFDAIIDAIKTNGKTNLLSSPRILALNNQEALINVGTREAFVTNTVVQSTSSATTAENVTFVDVGIKLKVTPTIGEDGFITLKIKPEVSSVARELKTAQGNVIPIVATQEAETTIVVKDGSTVIMGGLIEDHQVKRTDKVPIIGSLPILGVPFRREADKIKKNELVVFLTPHVVSGEMDLNSPSPEMMQYLESLDQEKQKAAEKVDFQDKPIPKASQEKLTARQKSRSAR